jgi:hypothetical protein
MSEPKVETMKDKTKKLLAKFKSGDGSIKLLTLSACLTFVFMIIYGIFSITDPGGIASVVSYFVIGIVSLLILGMNFLSRFKDKKYNWKYNVYEYLMIGLCFLTICGLIFSWFATKDIMDKYSTNLPDRYIRAEIITLILLIVQLVILYYYLFVKKIGANEERNPLLWLGILFCSFLISGIFIGEQFNIIMNFVTAG